MRDRRERLSVLVFISVAAGLCAAVFSGDVPVAMNYQGRLTDNMGNPLQAGYYHIQFRIWDHPTASGAGNLIWGREFALHVMQDGVFNILLTDDGGRVANPSPRVDSLANAFAAENRYLGLTITQTPAGPVPSPVEISPRQRLVSAPYAFHAQHATDAGSATTALLSSNAVHAVNAANADKLNNQPGTSYVLKSQFPGPQTPPKVLTWDGVNAQAVQAYVAGSTLRVDYDLSTRSVTATAGSVQPTVGSDVTAGVEFPANPGGGGGDRAYLKYYINSGESCTLKVGIENDPDDNLELAASGKVGLAGKNLDLRSSGDLLVSGNVKSLGGVAWLSRCDSRWDKDVDEIAPRDCFYIILTDNSRCDVQLTLAAGGTVSLPTIYTGDNNGAVLNTIPAAKGDRIKINNIYAINGSHSWRLYVFRRDIGSAAP